MKPYYTGTENEKHVTGKFKGDYRQASVQKQVNR